MEYSVIIIDLMQNSDKQWTRERGKDYPKSSRNQSDFLWYSS